MIVRAGGHGTEREAIESRLDRHFSPASYGYGSWHACGVTRSHANRLRRLATKPVPKITGGAIRYMICSPFPRRGSVFAFLGMGGTTVRCCFENRRARG